MGIISASVSPALFMARWRIFTSVLTRAIANSVERRSPKKTFAARPKPIVPSKFTSIGLAVVSSNGEAPTDTKIGGRDYLPRTAAVFA
jgi:hypothetical protein